MFCLQKSSLDTCPQGIFINMPKTSVFTAFSTKNKTDGIPKSCKKKKLRWGIANPICDISICIKISFQNSYCSKTGLMHYISYICNSNIWLVSG